MNENSKKGSILEGKSLEEGGLIQQYTKGGIQHMRKNNTNTKDDGEDWVRERDKDECPKSYKELNKELKKGVKKWVQKL